MSYWSDYQLIIQNRAALSGTQTLHGSHQADAGVYVRLGVNLLKENYEAFVSEIFTWAEASAELALKSKDFNQIYTRWLRSEEKINRHLKNPAVEPDIPRPVSDEELAIEQSYGRMETLRSVGYARWFLTGELPLQVWQQMTDCHRDYYEADSKKWGASSLTRLLHDMVAAERYQDALTAYKRDTPSWAAQQQEIWEAKKRDAENPSERRLEQLREERAAGRLLASSARQGLGRNRFPGALRSGLEKEIDRCTLGTRMDNSPQVLRLKLRLKQAGFMPSRIFFDKPWEERLGWSSLHGRFFTGQTDAREIIRSWRS